MLIGIDFQKIGIHYIYYLQLNILTGSSADLFHSFLGSQFTHLLDHMRGLLDESLSTNMSTNLFSSFRLLNSSEMSFLNSRYLSL